MKKNKIIEHIKEMDEKNKLRLAICLNDSIYSHINYNKKEMLKKFVRQLREIDEEYRTTPVNFSKYKYVIFTMSKIMELEVEEQNQVALVLFNSINLDFKQNLYQ